MSCLLPVLEYYHGTASTEAIMSLRSGDVLLNKRSDFVGADFPAGRPGRVYLTPPSGGRKRVLCDDQPALKSGFSVSPL